MSRYVPCKMADELTTIARRSYGASAVVVKNATAEERFTLFVENKFVLNQIGTTHEEAFRTLRTKLETMAMLTEVQRVKETAKDAAETKRMVDEFAELAKRAYPNCVPVFDAATRTFTVTRSGETLVTETGVTTFDAYRAVMPKLRDEAVALDTALKSFNALPALMNEVFGADAQLIVQTQQPYVTIESRIGKHTVFASSAAATTQEAVSASHEWLTSLKVMVPTPATIAAEARRVFGPGASVTSEGDHCWISSANGLEWRYVEDGSGREARKALARLRCRPSKTVAGSEATASEARTTGVSDEASIEELSDKLLQEARRVCGPGTEIQAGHDKAWPYVSVSSDNFYAMRESRATALEVREAMLARLRAMPTFVAPQPSTIAAFNNAVADDLKTRLMPATPAGMGALTYGASAYAGCGVRDTITSPDGTTFSNGSAPVNLRLTVTNTTPEQKAPPTMQPPAPTPIMDTVKADAEAAAWMLAGSQFVKLTKEPIVALLSRHLGPGDDSLRARIAAFLDTELGTAIVAAILSGGLSAMPAPPGSPAANINARLARELRVKSMATVGDAAVDLIAGPMRQVISLYIAGATAFPMGLPDGADRIVVPSTVADAVAK